MENKKKTLKCIIFSLFTFCSFLMYFNILFKFESYNIFVSIFFFVIIYAYFKLDDKYNQLDNKTKKYSSIISFVFSTIITVGCIVNRNYMGEIAIFNLKRVVLSILCIYGFYNFLKLFIAIGIKKVISLNINEHTKNKKMSTKLFLLIVLLIFLAWLPYFLRYFPALMTPDSYYVLEYANKGILSDFHTFGHTWFVGIFFLLGKMIFNNLNLAVAFYITIQMIICSFVFTLCIKLLYEKNINKYIYYTLICVFMFLPTYALFSITLWRDVLFGMSFLTLFISIYDIIDNKYKLTKSNVLLYSVSLLAMLFFRNNGIYIYMFMLPFVIYFSKPIRKKTILFSILFLLVYFLIKGPIFSYFNVQKTTSVEAFSIPLQQVARVVYLDQSMDSDIYNYFSSIMDFEEVKENYSPVISDSTKNATNNKLLSDDKLTFFANWFKLFLKHPDTYVEAYLCQTLGYWYPDVIYWATPLESSSIFDDLDVYSDSKLPKLFNVIDSVASRRIPLSIFCWSAGLSFMILISSTLLIIYKKMYNYILCYIPIYGLWLSIMIATPVFSEFRYIYGLVVCVPLLVLVPLLKLKN